MISLLSLTRKANPKNETESALSYEDRIEEEAFWTLHRKERAKEEEKEYEELKRKFGGKIALESSQFPCGFADEDIKLPVERLHRELVAQFGRETPQKKVLIQRLVCTYNMAWSYERMFTAMKYRKADDGYSFSFDRDRTKFLTEVRKGMESVNDQILRLTQALQNISSPPINVQVKNAVIAQNMQINQSTTPKDFDKVPASKNNAKTPS